MSVARNFENEQKMGIQVVSDPMQQEMVSLYQQYLLNAAAVSEEWRAIFDNLDEDAASLLEALSNREESEVSAKEQFELDHQTYALDHQTYALDQEKEVLNFEPQVTLPSDSLVELTSKQNALNAARAQMMIRDYRFEGHFKANLDPLGLCSRKDRADLDPLSYGFTEKDLAEEIPVDGELGLDKITVRGLIERLEKVYCDTIGAEFTHLQDAEERNWIQNHIEDLKARSAHSTEKKKEILMSLTWSAAFEKYLHVKYPGSKRFGLDGAETLIPALGQLLVTASKTGVEEVLFGMAHRGRLNVLANVIGKPCRAIFSEFRGEKVAPEDIESSGDVKYHLGYSTKRQILGQEIRLSLAANPSHLEAVNPVVTGKVHAKQAQKQDQDRSKVVNILMHGDAAMAGQGLVAETLSMSQVPGYTVGGTIHVVINNQIGFTTSPKFSRSSPYCSDVAKMIQAPVFHVNGNDPEAVIYVARLAMEFRQRFKKDVVIDLFCYRRFGHNEIDEPSFTQPLMYKKIVAQDNIRDLYAQKLISEGVVTREESEKYQEDYQHMLQKEMEASEKFTPQKADWLEGVWSGFEAATTKNRLAKTGVSFSVLKDVGKALIRYPKTFTIHPRLKRILDQKAKKLEAEKDIDWGTAEALAFGTLLTEGHAVRLSGQDCGRGTFSQRHSVFIDQQSEEKYVPLNNISADQKTFTVLDSPLSEASVLGFEYGYSLSDPNTLVLWEAQFGDFANGAQVITDQFISSGEAKWLRLSGLVMLLPHGDEGNGPEHSSARLERYLQLSAEGNWQVANCTTPANYFHILRRQMHRKIRKPLVLMTPKSLLRHRLAVSSLADMGPKTTFKPVIGEVDTKINTKDVRRVILCSGKIYYDLVAQRHANENKHVAIIRLEELYPFPQGELAKELEQYRHAQVVWCQEEPQNNGAWSFVSPQIERLLLDIGHASPRPVYVGREAAASPASGYFQQFEKVQKQIVCSALEV